VKQQEYISSVASELIGTKMKNSEQVSVLKQGILTLCDKVDKLERAVQELCPHDKYEMHIDMGPLLNQIHTKRCVVCNKNLGFNSKRGEK
jgi:hypothetical protein